MRAATPSTLCAPEETDELVEPEASEVGGKSECVPACALARFAANPRLHASNPKMSEARRIRTPVRC
jgi:hypothetical protein